MTPEQFCYWLQGASETIEGVPSERQWKVIADHLATVFNKVTPDRKVTDDKNKLFEKDEPYRTGAAGGTSGVRIC